MSAAEPYLPDDGSWHAIGQEAATRPPVSACQVKVCELDQWTLTWTDVHLVHEGAYDRILQPCDEDTCDHYDDDDQPVEVIRCCGFDHPPIDAPKVTVEASAQPFVTIHD